MRTHDPVKFYPWVTYMFFVLQSTPKGSKLPENRASFQVTTGSQFENQKSTEIRWDEFELCLGRTFSIYSRMMRTTCLPLVNEDGASSTVQPGSGAMTTGNLSIHVPIEDTILASVLKNQEEGTMLLAQVPTSASPASVHTAATTPAKPDASHSDACARSRPKKTLHSPFLQHLPWLHLSYLVLFKLQESTLKKISSVQAISKMQETFFRIIHTLSLLRN